MSIFKKLTEKGSGGGETNIEQMLAYWDDDLLVQIPQSQYWLKCKDLGHDLWSIKLINPHKNNDVLLYRGMKGDGLRALLFELFGIES